MNWDDLEPYRSKGIPWDVLESLLLQAPDQQKMLEELKARGFRGVETPDHDPNIERAEDESAEFDDPLGKLLGG